MSQEPKDVSEGVQDHPKSLLGKTPQSDIRYTPYTLYDRIHLSVGKVPMKGKQQTTEKLRCQHYHARIHCNGSERNLCLELRRRQGKYV